MLQTLNISISKTKEAFWTSKTPHLLGLFYLVRLRKIYALNNKDAPATANAATQA